MIWPCFLEVGRRRQTSPFCLQDKPGLSCQVGAALPNHQPFIPVAEPLLGDKELAYVTDCVKSGWVSSLGKYVRDFESQFAAYCDTQYGVAAFNGTVALHLLAATLNLGPGDEVIMPSLTYVATANAIQYTGATPIFVDSERETWKITDVSDFQFSPIKTGRIIQKQVEWGRAAEDVAVRLPAD